MRAKIYQWLCKLPAKVVGGAVGAFGIGEKFLPNDWPEKVIGISPELGHFWGDIALIAALVYVTALWLLKPSGGGDDNGGSGGQASHGPLSPVLGGAFHAAGDIHISVVGGQIVSTDLGAPTIDGIGLEASVTVKEAAMSDDEKFIPMFNTIVGKGAPESFSRGYGNTYLGATDDRGNAIYNTPMSVGFKAGHAPGSIIVGAFAAQNLGRGKVDDSDDS